jgi:hypothetical protein
MAEWLKKWGVYGRNGKFLTSLGTAFIFLFAALIISFFAITYATERASGPVTDIILSNIRVFDVNGIFLYGPVIFWTIMIGYMFSDPKRIPFTFKTIALFLLIRSIFISLTHIGPFLPSTYVNNSGISGILDVFTSGNDLFFSGHTGLPFLLALIFWENKYARVFCLASSVFFGAIVLMAHLHYSIDVFAAFFITYTIFCIAKEIIFKKDYQIGLNEINGLNINQ